MDVIGYIGDTKHIIPFNTDDEMITFRDVLSDKWYKFEKIILPHGLYVFLYGGNKNLTSIELPSTIEEVRIFNCSLNDIKIPHNCKKVRIIGNNIKSILIPSSVEDLSIHSNNLENIYFEDIKSSSLKLLISSKCLIKNFDIPPKLKFISIFNKDNDKHENLFDINPLVETLNNRDYHFGLRLSKYTKNLEKIKNENIEIILY